MKYDIIDALREYQKTKSLKEFDNFIQKNNLDINGTYVKWLRNFGSTPDEMAMEAIIEDGNMPDEYCCVADICLEAAAKWRDLELLEHLIEIGLRPGTSAQFGDTERGVSNICENYPDIAMHYLEKNGFVNMQDIRNAFYVVIDRERFSPLTKKIFQIFKNKVYSVDCQSWLTSIIEPIITNPVDWDDAQWVRKFMKDITVAKVPEEWYKLLDEMYKVPSGTFTWSFMEKFYRYRGNQERSEEVERILSYNSSCSKYLLRKNNPWDTSCYYNYGIPWKK